MNHAALHKKGNNCNKPCHVLLFKFDLDEKEQHIAEGIEKFISNTPRLLKRHRIKAIKDVVMHVIELHFMKDNVKLNLLLPAVSDELNLCTNMCLEIEEEK